MVMIFAAGASPLVIAESDKVVIDGNGSQCEVERIGRPGNYHEGQISTHHDCDDHDVLIIWPNRMYAGICNCGPIRKPHALTMNCYPDRRIG